MADSVGTDVARQRSTLMLAMIVAVPVTLAIWLALYRLLPPVAGMASVGDRLWFAFGCSCVAILLCFLTGIEAVAHRRLFSPAIDPLAGAEGYELKVDQRYLQHTLEQLVLFVPGLFGLAYYSPSGESMRAVAATAGVWILARFAFWIGYRKAPRYRAAGLTGMFQSMIVLLWVVYRFGEGLGGPIFGAAPVALFLLIEAVLLIQARR